MNQKVSPGNNMGCPGIVICKCGLKTVAPVYKYKPQGCRPFAGRHLRPAHKGDHRIFEVGRMQGLSKRSERIDTAGIGIKQVRIKIFLPGLLLFRPLMMINGKKNISIFLAACPQIEC